MIEFTLASRMRRQKVVRREALGWLERRRLSNFSTTPLPPELTGSSEPDAPLAARG